MSIRAIDWAWRQQVGNNSAKLVLLALADYTNDNSGQCWPSLRTIEKKTGLSHDTVVRGIRLLKSKGLLTVIHRCAGSSKLSNLYELDYKHERHAKSAEGSTKLVPTVVAELDDQLQNSPNTAASESDPGSNKMALAAVAQSDPNRHIEPLIETYSLSKTGVDEHDLIQYAEATCLFGKLSEDVFGTKLGEIWPQDTAKWLRKALPLKREDWNVIDWLYRLPDDHEVFKMTFRRQSMIALLENLEREIQKARLMRKRMKRLDDSVTDRSDGQEAGWTDKRRRALEALFPGAAYPGPFELLDRDLRTMIDEKAKGLAN
jgi:Helix-turn-helix domain